MTESNALLIRLERGAWNAYRGSLGEDRYIFDPNYQIFVPERFVFGNLKETKKGFRLTSDNILYKDSKKALEEYQKDIDEKKFIIEERLFLPDVILDWIKQRGEAYVALKEEILCGLGSIDEYVV